MAMGKIGTDLTLRISWLHVDDIQLFIDS